MSKNLLNAAGEQTGKPKTFKAVRSETAAHDYDEVILATGRQDTPRLAQLTGRDPVQQLRRKWGQQLPVFQESDSQESPS